MHKQVFPKKNSPQRKPNKITLQAMQESKKGKGIKCDSIDDFWKKMEIDPNDPKENIVDFFKNSPFFGVNLDLKRN